VKAAENSPVFFTQVGHDPPRGPPAIAPLTNAFWADRLERSPRLGESIRQKIWK
jgi:hypothetical protein